MYASTSELECWYSDSGAPNGSRLRSPSIDAIDEFKVVTSPFAAEYGRAPGGAIVVTTKSGTNRVFGTAYDYFRDERFGYFADNLPVGQWQRYWKGEASALPAGPRPPRLPPHPRAAAP